MKGILLIVSIKKMINYRGVQMATCPCCGEKLEEIKGKRKIAVQLRD